MVKPMKYKDLVAMLKAAGFTRSEGKGDHEKWAYPGIRRPVILTQTRELSPAVTKNALKAIEEKEQSNDSGNHRYR